MSTLPKCNSMKWCRTHPITIELLKFIKQKEKIIDLGCGIGQRTFLVAEENDVEITGVDLSLEGITYAKKWYKLPNLNYIHADLTSLSFDSEFDSAFMLAVIEHIDDTEKLLTCIKKILKPNGRLFISVTNKGFHRDVSDIHIFSKEKLRKILERYYTIKNIYIKDKNIFVECHV